MEFSNPKSRNRHNRHLWFHSKSGSVWRALVCVVFFSNIGLCQKSADEDAIRTMLDDQVTAWNRGNVAGYMRGYWESDSTIFTSGGTVTRGYREVLSRYKKSYDTPKKMGRLEFHDLVVQSLSPTIALAMGIWELHRASDRPWGRFTLIIEKKPEGWRITNDHTSSAGD